MSEFVGVGEVDGAAAAVRLVAARLDPDLLMANECERALHDAAAIEAMGATMKMLLAARLAETDAYKATSSVSPEAHIAGLVGGTAASVRSLIETARAARRVDGNCERGSGGFALDRAGAGDRECGDGRSDGRARAHRRCRPAVARPAP